MKNGIVFLEALSVCLQVCLCTTLKRNGADSMIDMLTFESLKLWLSGANGTPITSDVPLMKTLVARYLEIGQN
jgi:hypothetical protein